MNEALKINGSTSIMVVSSREGMDEISISDITYASRLCEGRIHEFEIDPQEYGIRLVPLKAIVGGDATFNAEILHNIFNSKATDAQRDIVCLNAAAAFMIDGYARDIQDGLEIAQKMIKTGKAKEKLKQIIDISNKL